MKTIFILIFHKVFQIFVFYGFLKFSCYQKSPEQGKFALKLWEVEISKEFISSPGQLAMSLFCLLVLVSKSLLIFLSLSEGKNKPSWVPWFWKKKERGHSYFTNSESDRFKDFLQILYLCIRVIGSFFERNKSCHDNLGSIGFRQQLRNVIFACLPSLLYLCEIFP